MTRPTGWTGRTAGPVSYPVRLWLKSKSASGNVSAPAGFLIVAELASGGPTV